MMHWKLARIGGRIRLKRRRSAGRTPAESLRDRPLRQRPCAEGCGTILTLARKGPGRLRCDACQVVAQRAQKLESWRRARTGRPNGRPPTAELTDAEIRKVTAALDAERRTVYTTRVVVCECGQKSIGPACAACKKERMA